MVTEFNVKVGDTIKVTQKVKDGKRERLVPFKGLLMRVRGKDENRMITVKAVLDGVEVDRIFPVNNPTITEINTVEKPKKKVHRARLLKIPSK